MPLPEVSVVEVDQESTIVEESASVEVITDTVEVASFLLESEDVAIIEVGIQGPPGAAGTGSGVTANDELAEYVSEKMVYRASAAPGTAQDAPGWRIECVNFAFTPDLVVTTTWPNGSQAFAHKWSERASYTYTE